MPEWIKSFFSIRNIISLITIMGIYWILRIVSKDLIPEKNREIFIILATLAIKDGPSRIYRYYFPDKDEKPKPIV